MISFLAPLLGAGSSGSVKSTTNHLRRFSAMPHNLPPSSYAYIKVEGKNYLSLYISQSYFDIFEFLSFDDFL